MLVLHWQWQLWTSWYTLIPLCNQTKYIFAFFLHLCLSSWSCWIELLCSKMHFKHAAVMSLWTFLFFYLSWSSERLSMFRGLILSARTFFFFSLSVCFLPLFWSIWKCKNFKIKSFHSHFRRGSKVKIPTGTSKANTNAAQHTLCRWLLKPPDPILVSAIFFLASSSARLRMSASSFLIRSAWRWKDISQLCSTESSSQGVFRMTDGPQVNNVKL